MMRTILYIIIFGTGVALFGCTENKHHPDVSVINVKDMVGRYNILNISDYCDAISYIPLETGDSVLIAEIEQIIYENEQIVIKDKSASCLVFDRNGRYLHHLGRRGQGPNDYLFVRDMFAYNDSILLYAPPGKVLIYHGDGRLIDNISLPKDLPKIYMVYHVCLLKKDIYLADVVAPGNVHYPKAMLFRAENGRMEILREFPNPVHYEKEISGFSIAHEVATLYRFNNGIRSYKVINDTIFTVGEDLEIRDAFVFDFGKYGVSLKGMFELARHTEPVHIFPINIMESTDCLFIEFLFGNHAPEPFEYTKTWSDGTSKRLVDYRVFGVFDKRTGDLKLMNQPVGGQLGFGNDVDGGPVIWPHYVSSRDEMISFVEAEDFLESYSQMKHPSSEQAGIAAKIRPDDNPVVIIAGMKSKRPARQK
jgi:hypothetical protein